MFTKAAYTNLVLAGAEILKTIRDKEKAIEAMEAMSAQAHEDDYNIELLEPVWELMNSSDIHEAIAHLVSAIRDDDAFFAILYCQAVSLYVFDNSVAEQYCNATYEYMQSNGANVAVLDELEKGLDKDELLWVRRHV